MEWVETTGKTVEEAKDLALDQLGVDEEEAEFEVVEEPKSGLFRRGEARVRARVRPTQPRSKDNGRRRRREPKRGSGGSGNARAKAPARDSASATGDNMAGGSQPRRRNRNRSSRTNAEQGETMSTDVPMQDQAEVAATFLEGLVDAFGYDADAGIREIDEDTIEVGVTGGDLGLLIGPKGQTLQAVQDLARTVVYRKTQAGNGRVLVDVAGYREKRRVALAKFSHDVADDVLANGGERALEPMGPADRKVVHDTIGEIDGVTTSSEGEEPRRRVVVKSA